MTRHVVIFLLVTARQNFRDDPQAGTPKEENFSLSRHAVSAPEAILFPSARDKTAQKKRRTHSLPPTFLMVSSFILALCSCVLGLCFRLQNNIWGCTHFSLCISSCLGSSSLSTSMRLIQLHRNCSTARGCLQPKFDGCPELLSAARRFLVSK